MKMWPRLPSRCDGDGDPARGRGSVLDFHPDSGHRPDRWEMQMFLDLEPANCCARETERSRILCVDGRNVGIEDAPRCTTNIVQQPSAVSRAGHVP